MTSHCNAMSIIHITVPAVLYIPFTFITSQITWMQTAKCKGTQHYSIAYLRCWQGWLIYFAIMTPMGMCPSWHVIFKVLSVCFALESNKLWRRRCRLLWAICESCNILCIYIYIMYLISNVFVRQISSFPISTRATKTPAFWGYPPPPHDYPHYWVMLDPNSKLGRITLKI